MLTSTTFHVAHLNAYTNGGATSLDNCQAWCSDCNLTLGAVDVGTDVQPREWQQEALPMIVEELMATRVATLSAAPGAGKTLFAGMVFNALAGEGVIERMVIFVPRGNLVTQWKLALGQLRIHVDDQPRDGVIELRGTVGSAVTYQSLSLTSAEAHRVEADRSTTLVILDEVHHIGENNSWGTSLRALVGSVEDIRVGAVLNLTGTLFRSKARERISTVRYTALGGGRVQARADYVIHADQLITKGELRKPVLYRMKGRAQVVDVMNGTTTVGEIADLDEAMASAAVKQALGTGNWMTEFIREGLAMLTNAQDHIGEKNVALKMLYVASDQKAARKAADVINQITGREFARLVTSDEGSDARRALERVLKDDQPCAIVTCQMVTEGFDHPPVAVIAYASHYKARLFVAQMMARAMRVTDYERSIGRVLPAQILIPDIPALVDAFEQALIGEMHLLNLADEGPENPDGGPSLGGTDPRSERFELIDLSRPALGSANVLGEDDGEVTLDDVEEWRRHGLHLGFPEIYVPQAVVISRRVRQFPRIYSQGTATTTTANPRDVHNVWKARLNRAVKWWHLRLPTRRFDSIPVINAKVNEVMGVRIRADATTEQIREGYAWIVNEINEYCEHIAEEPPAWIIEEGQADD